MAKTNEFVYVLVVAQFGPVFITKVNNDKSVEWHKDEKPVEISKNWAKDMVKGLLWRGIPAYVVCSEFEIDRQPCRYSDGEYKWIWHENNMKS